MRLNHRPTPGIDQRGYMRPGPGLSNCSIAAFEAGYPAPPCTGDCNNDDEVAINELILGVSIALGRQPVTTCPTFDRDTQDGAEIHELVAAVRNALSGCSG